jgi:hypothetical protein
VSRKSDNERHHYVAQCVALQAWWGVTHKQTGNDFVCGIVLYRGSKLMPFGDKLWAVPVDVMWV